MILQNRCRIRRNFAQSIAILDNMQAVAEEVDSDILAIASSGDPAFSRPEPSQFYPISAWVFHHKLRVMEQTVQLGFELDIYLPDEFARMYSFLAHLAQTRSTHLEPVSYTHLRSPRD